jgi:ornithine cyclodeaminase/alanine dehydrogenase-like protein (mu-crystallin family)
MGQPPIFVSVSDTQAVLEPVDVVNQCEQALRWDAAGAIQWPAPRSLNIAPDRWGNDYHMKACVLEEIPVAGLRLVSHPLDESSPICTRLILLIDPATSLPLAIVDESWNYAQRTVASIALASRHLARDDAATLAVIGAGRLARTAIDYFATQFPLTEIRIAARREESRRALADDVAARMQVDVAATDRIEDAVRGADLVLTATSATEALLRNEWVGPGTVVACVGTAEAGRDLAEQCDLFVVDSREQLRKELVAEYGESAPDWIDATVGEVVAGSHPGRTTAEQRALIITEGLASQDIAIAYLAYSRVRDRGAGLSLPVAAAELVGAS